MRTINFIFFFFFLILFSNLNAQNIFIYVGTDTLSSNYPFTTYWMDGRTDMLYLENEITSAGGVPGYFTSIAFYVNSADTITMNGFNVKMQNTLDTSLTTFGNAWEICYSGTYKVLTTGWQTIYFTQPFGWNGNDNLKIEICYNNNRYTYYSTVRSTLIPRKTYGAYQDLSNGDGCVDLTTGTVQARRPNICLELTPITGINNFVSIPEKYYLSQNYPNPFNPETRINYTIPKAGKVSIIVYDALGRQVSELVNGYKNAGNYIVEFNSRGLSSGVYYYKMLSGDFSDIKKMVVIK